MTFKSSSSRSKGVPNHSDKSTPKTPVLSVSELNQFSRGTLEMHVGQVWVSGEISNFSQPASGHWYFTLKDDNAQVRCAMFKGKNQFIRTNIHSGMQVLLNGKVSLYEGRGDYQLIADYIEESGIGSMARAFEALKAKLNKEGLFEQNHKRAIPKQLTHIAVITSETGAAIHDILKVLKERFPALNITLIPASVQGDNAPVELIGALKQAYRYNQQQTIDAVIIGRGGGSEEDLWAFNNERLARAVYAFPIPIISAVGHEVDVSICDLVADVRAATPSAAAEMISPDQNQVRQQIDYIEQRLEQAMFNKLLVANQQLKLQEQSLQHPRERIQFYQAAFNDKQTQLNKAVTHHIQLNQLAYQQAHQQLVAQLPLPKITAEKLAVTQLQKRLNRQIQLTIAAHKTHLANQASALNMISPLATLNRGYSIIKDNAGNIIRKAEQVSEGSPITAKLQDGELTAIVQSK